MQAIESAVEQRQSANGLPSASELLDLAKAYTAIASLDRAEEVELHQA